MSAALDVNILLHASHSADVLHERAATFLRQRLVLPDLTYVFWPTIMGYLRIVTHRGILAAPLSLESAVGNIDRLLARGNIRTGGEGDRFWPMLLDTIGGAGVHGNLVPDAHLVALMREHGVGTLYSRDRGIRRFDGIRVVDPLDDTD